MKLSIVIPCYNESKTIREIVKKVIEADIAPLEKEIIVVDDGSDNGTRDILRKDIEPIVDKVIYNQKNMGKGASLREGFKASTGDLVIVQDADLEYDPDDYHILLKPILEGKADVVFGSRFMGGEPHRVHLFWHYLGNRLLTTLSNMFTNLNLTDMETCYKLFKRDILMSIDLTENRFGFEPEITAKVARIKGVRIYEVGISYYGRGYEEGKKINWKDGFRAIYVILKYGIFIRRNN